MKNKETFSLIIAAKNEEENINNLVRSIFNQSYRPIEVIFVDDGSEDDTLMIVRKLKEELSSKSFIIDVFETKKDYSYRGPWAAWNFGLIKSNGEYILFLPGDAQLIEKDILEKLKESLVSNQLVSFYFKPIIDNQLEFNLALDFNPIKRPIYDAYQSKLIKKVMLDPNLGVGGDWDLPERLKKSGLLKKRKLIETEIGIHWPHTYKEYTSQRFWRGRTIWPLIRKYPKFNVFFRRLLFPISTFCLFFLSLVYLFIDLKLSMFFLICFFLPAIYSFLRSPTKNLNRLIHLIFIRFIFGSMIWAIGAVYGFYQYYIKNSFG